MYTSVTTSIVLLALVGGDSQTSPSSAKPKEPTSPGLKEVEGKTLKEWARDLTHRDPSRRTKAIQSIVLFGKASKEAVLHVADRTRDRDASPRVKAVMALRMMPVKQEDLPRVIKSLSSRVTPYSETQSIIRYQAAVSLLPYADKAHSAIPQLLQGARDRTSWEIRRACLAVLRQAGTSKDKGPDSRVTEAMLYALRDPSTGVRLEAITALGAMGSPHDPMLRKKVMDALTLQSSPRNFPVLRLWALVSYMSLDGKVPDESLKILAQHLQHADQDVRYNAVRALQAMSKHAKPAVLFLIDALNNYRDEDTAIAICRAIIQIDPRSLRVHRALSELGQRKGISKPFKEAIDDALKALKENMKKKPPPDRAAP